MGEHQTQGGGTAAPHFATCVLQYHHTRHVVTSSLESDPVLPLYCGLFLTTKLMVLPPSIDSVFSCQPFQPGANSFGTPHPQYDCMSATPIAVTICLTYNNYILPTYARVAHVTAPLATRLLVIFPGYRFFSKRLRRVGYGLSARKSRELGRAIITRSSMIESIVPRV